MKINIEPYVAVFPRIVKSSTVQKIKITPKFNFVKLGGNYNVSIFPRYQFEYSSSKEGAYYDPIMINADSDYLEFEYQFGKEQEYIIQVKPVADQGRVTQVIETSVYALDEDLYEKKVVKGDLHLHTTFSDGLESPEHRAMIARKEGFDFIAITDHNSFHGSDYLIEKMKKCPNNMVFLHGEEVHAKCCPVHILSLGASEAIAPKVTKYNEEQNKLLNELKLKYSSLIDNDVNLDAFVAAMDVFAKIREAGGLSVLCHIYWDAVDGTNHKRMGAPENLIDALVRECDFDAFEITSGAPVQDLKANYLQESYYREYLPKNFPVIGITDSHTTIDDMTIFGKNYTIAFVDEFNETGIINAIKNSFTVSVDGVGNNKICHGQLRLIKYATFLRERYFVEHDKAVRVEADLMERILLGELQLIDFLNVICKGTVDNLKLEWGSIVANTK